MRSPDEMVADYVRASMSVEPPASLGAEVMRAVSALPQERRGWLSTFGPYTPAIAAVAAAGLVIAIGLVLSGPRNIGPPTESDGPSAVPSLTPEDARTLTAPGDVIRIPAFDSQGQFGTIRLERGDEFGSYEGYIPLAAMEAGEVFFVEVHVTYEVDRATADPYGNVDLGFAVDADGDGLDEDDVIQQHLGYSIEGLELETGPSPLLPFVQGGPQPMSGWIAFELPAAGAEYDIYLVQMADPPDPDPSAPTVFTAVASALLREPAEPVGVTVYDFDNPPAFPEPTGELPVFQELPTPLPSPAATFEARADAEADALFADTQTCLHDSGVTVTFPASWHTNEAYKDLFACEWFAPEPMDVERMYEGFTDERPTVVLFESPSWTGGADQPNVPRADTSVRVPIQDRVGWRITYPDIPTSLTYLIPLTEEPYGPFFRATSGTVEAHAVLERIVLRLEFPEPDP